MERNNENKIISEVTTSEYKYGFVSDFDSDTIDADSSFDFEKFKNLMNQATKDY